MISLILYCMYVRIGICNTLISCITSSSTLNDLFNGSTTEHNIYVLVSASFSTHSWTHLHLLLPPLWPTPPASFSYASEGSVLPEAHTLGSLLFSWCYTITLPILKLISLYSLIYKVVRQAESNIHTGLKATCRILNKIFT